MDNNLYNITCSCIDDNFTHFPKCNSSFQTLPNINCNFTTEQCAITSGENKDCSCEHNLLNIMTLVQSTLECCYCPQNEGTDAMLGCNYFTNKSTTTTTISNIQSQNDHGTTVATTTVHNVAIATHNAANTVPTVTISSSILPIITTTPVTGSIVVPGVLLPVCLLCTISTVATILCIILYYRRHQQSGTTQYVLMYYYYTSVLYYHTIVI